MSSEDTKQCCQKGQTCKAESTTPCCVASAAKCFVKDGSCYCIVACGPKTSAVDLEKTFAEMQLKGVVGEECECDCSSSEKCECKCFEKEGGCICVVKCCGSEGCTKEGCEKAGCSCTCKCTVGGQEYVFKINCVCGKGCSGCSCSCSKEGATVVCQVNCSCAGDKCGGNKGSCNCSQTGKCSCAKDQCRCTNCPCKSGNSCKTKGCGK